VALDLAHKQVRLEDGRMVGYDRLLLCTGAEPVRLEIPGATLPHVSYLRSLADSRAIIERANQARRAVVVGGSFIGLEVAAALRARKLEVHVVAPESVPLQHVMGPELGLFLRQLHESHGVVFHLGHKPTAITNHAVTLDDGTELPADLVVIGVGVRPRVELATQAGLRVDNGVLVDEYLETSHPGVYAAGDLARWPDPHSGERIRVEHWVVAERQGQTAARNLIGERERFDAVPFFWSQHYDVGINYVGHARGWDRIEIDGDPANKDCAVRFYAAGKLAALATIYRDLESLQAEVEFEARPRT
jgi:NADPH-dependent 2,4-dienoyl-CoA reductase/sulfur reductase-like enzyme